MLSLGHILRGTPKFKTNRTFASSKGWVSNNKPMMFRKYFNHFGKVSMIAASFFATRIWQAVIDLFEWPQRIEGPQWVTCVWLHWIRGIPNDP